MTHSRVSDIKRSQKERLLFRELSQLYLQLVLDNPPLRNLSLSRVRLSPDKSMCTLFFYTDEGIDAFKEYLEILKLYRPSLRKAIAGKIESRYVPDLRFKFDETYEKQEAFEELMEQIKTGDDQVE